MIAREGRTIAREGRTIAREGRSIAGEGRSITGEGTSITREGRSIAGEGTSIAGEGRSIRFGKTQVVWACAHPPLARAMMARIRSAAAACEMRPITSAERSSPAMRRRRVASR